MTEPTDVRELLRLIAAHAGSWGDNTRLLGNLTALEIGEACEQADAALERLEALEGFLDREGIRRGPIDHGLPTPTLVDRVEAYGHECAARAIRATPAPAPQGGEE